MRLLDRPSPGYSLAAVIGQIGSFGSSAIVQTMICRGEHDGQMIDNSTDEEISALIEAYRAIAPGEIMIYSIDRPTPETLLRQVA